MTSARDTLRQAMTEKEWLDAVLQTAQLFGWRTYHTFDSRRSPAGFPDLVLVRPPRLLFVELKTTKGRVTAKQLEWVGALADCTTIEAGVFRPTDEDALLDLLRPDTGAR